MIAERWDRVREVFGEALERDPAQWQRFLQRTCAGDPELRAEVESLLEAHRAGRGFLEPRAEEAKRSPATSNMDPVSDRRVGAYELERCIGRGGMGTVYSAVRADAAFEKRVAVKLLKRDLDSTEVARRFRAERQILAGLDHPNIARLIDGGSAGDGRPYLVMEYVDGQPVDEYCNARELPVAARIELFRTVCSAVQFAHRNLVVHRDLKPSNILVTGGGEVKLLDFGIAKILDPELKSRTPLPTATVLGLMTPEYASPEQLLGEPVTTVSDVYSLGVLLYILLTGRQPFGCVDRSPLEVLWAVRNEEPEAPSNVVGRAPASRGLGPGSTPARRAKLRRQLAGDLDNIVLTALRKEPARRYGSVDQLSEDLRRHLAGHPVSARKDTFVYRCGKFLHRHRLAVSAAGAFLVAALGFGIQMAIQRSQIARQRDRVEEQRRQTEVERRRAQRVTSFLVDLFEVSDPYSSGVDSRDVTARELLDQGARRLAAELAGQPEIRAELSHTIASIYRRLGLLEEAAPLLEDALKARREILGSDHAKVAQSLGEQGLLYQARGDYESAKTALGQALSLRRRLFGETHQAVAESLSHLAGLAQATGDFHQAERLYRRALAVYREHFGADNAVVADVVHQLALNLQSQGDFAGAEPLYHEALALHLGLFGEEHVQVANTRANLAQLALARGDPERAETLYRRALKTLRRALGDDHVEVAFCLHSLAAVAHQRGELEAAESRYREALEILSRRLGPRHPDLATTLNGLASVLQAANDPAAAERAYRAALAIRRGAFGEANPLLVPSLTGLARVAVEGGDCTTAERLLHEALGIARQAFPGGHWRTAVAESLLGVCLIRSRHYSEAESLLLESYRVLRQSKGEQATATLKTAERLVLLYEAWEGEASERGSNAKGR